MYFWEAFARAVGATTVCHNILGAVAVVAAAARTTHSKNFLELFGAVSEAMHFWSCCCCCYRHGSQRFSFLGCYSSFDLAFLFLLIVAILLLTTIIWHFQR